MSDSFYTKYLKYKNKYLELKNKIDIQQGGADDERKMRLVFYPGYGWVFTTLTKEEQEKQVKTVMAYVPKYGWVLTTMFDLNPSKDGEDDEDKTKYYFIPGRGITVHNPKMSGMFASFIPVNQLKFVGAMPNIFK